MILDSLERYFDYLQLSLFVSFIILLVYMFKSALFVIWWINLTWCAVALYIRSKSSCYPIITSNIFLESLFRSPRFVFILHCQIMWFQYLKHQIIIVIRGWFCSSSPYFNCFRIRYIFVCDMPYHYGKVSEFSTSFVFYTFSFEIILIV